MEKRKYQLLLTEEFLDTSLFPESAFTGGYTNKSVLEIGSSEATYSWQVHDYDFYTKIDGTHTLSFSLDDKYFDVDAGALVENELVKYLTNKCKIEVRREDPEYSPDEQGKPVYKIYFMTINEKEEKKNNGIITYTYSCTDSYIEELSKTGYEIQFSDDIEVGNGIGTIHDFAKQVADGSDWKYREDKTGTLIEYLTNEKWNEEQQRFDEEHIPIPSYTYKFIPEISQYAYQLETCAEIGDDYYVPFYCAEMMDMAQTIPVKNLISNGSEFTDVIGWNSFRKDGGNLLNGEYVIEPYQNKDHYYLRISGINPSYLLNETMINNNTVLEAYQPYLFKYTTESNRNIFKGIYIDSENPYTQKKDMSKSKYKILMDFKPNTYYVIKPTKFISSPFFSLYTEIQNTTDLIDVEFFKVQGRDENSHLTLMSQLSNGARVTETQLSQMLLPDSAGEDIDAYYDRKIKFFSRKNYQIQLSTNKEIHKDPYIEDELEYYSFDDINNASWKLDKVGGVTTIINNNPLSIETVDELPQEGDKSKVYLLSSDNYYYQYYTVEKDGISNSEWNYARLGNGQKDKIRTLVISKSNRFNIIQEIAELFQVWPVFEVYRNEDQSLTKEFWFRESALRDNFSGFHAGINISNITRKLDSDDIVTKMYVEDIEKSYITDGKISIALSARNPWGERYYYNFRYYIENNFVGQEINNDKNRLYARVKELNTKLKKYSDEYSSYYETYRNNEDKIYVYNVQISSLTERVTKLTETINGLVQKGADDQLPDKVNAEASLSNYSKQKEKYQTEAKKLIEENSKIKDRLDYLSATMIEVNSQKKSLISQFETKYSQFIKEGTWTDSSYANNDTYYIDSQKVSNTSAIPKASWTIGVVDGSGTEELKDFHFQVGDKTFLIDNDFFHNSNKRKDYKFEILITGYHDYFDNPQKNQAEVRNYLTSFEDLFQRISAATQSLELNEQIYDKAKRFTANGEVESDILQKSFLNNNFVLANSKDNSYELSSEGLKLQSISNPSKKLRITSDGLFISKGINKETGEPEWSTGITGDGINASLITAGEIDTSLVKIFGGDGQELFAWNDLGITAYHTATDANSFTRFDQFGFYIVTEKSNPKNAGYINFNYNENGEPWWTRPKKMGQEVEFYIEDRSLVSLTKFGFHLNVPSSTGDITLGFLNSDPNQRTTYGLRIKDENGNSIVKLSNKENQIGGFSIKNDWLWGKQAGFRSNFNDSNNIFIYAGEEWQEGEAMPNTMPFFVRANGEMRVKGFDFDNLWLFGKSSGIRSDSTGRQDAILYAGADWGSGETMPQNMPFFVTGNGYVYCQKLFVNGTEVGPGGGGGGGTAGYQLPFKVDCHITAGYPTYPSGKRHRGIDYCTNDGDTYGKPIYPINEGVVQNIVHNHSTYGNYITIYHSADNILSLYAHGSSFPLWLSEGDTVTEDTIIMYAGSSGNSTGPHLHLEVRESPFNYGNDIDPEIYVPSP